MAGVPCEGCGDPTCACCFADSADIERLQGTGNQGDCYQLGFVTGAVPGHLCAESPAGPTLAGGDAVVVCLGGTTELRPFQDACAEFSALPAAVGPAIPGDEVVIFDGLTCVRKTITPSDCPPAPRPAILGTCGALDLVPVWCEPLTNDLRTLPRDRERSADLVLAGWAVNLLFLAQNAPFVVATSGVATLTNPSCRWDMTAMLVGEPGVLTYTGPSGVWYLVEIEEQINGGGWGGIYAFYTDYTGQLSAGLTDSKAIPSWNRTFTVPAGGALTYEWRMVITRLHPNVPNINGVVTNTSSRVTMIGGSL